MAKKNFRERRSVGIGDFGETLTEQNHKERVQIQNILHRYTKTGMLLHVNSLEGTYGDFPNHIDFKTMQDTIAAAKSMFESIPAQIRAKFDNNPAKFLEKVHDTKEHEALIEMGFHPDDLPGYVEPETPAAEPVPEPAHEPPTEPTV